MKNNIIKTVLFSGLVILSSCETDDSINTDPYGQTLDELKQDDNNVRGYMAGMFNNILTLNPAWQAQLQQNLIGDVYSGYMMPPTPFRGNLNNMTYDLVDGWNQFAWDIAYQNIMFNAYWVKQRGEESAPQYYGISLILKVLGMHRISDIYGPIVYTKYGESEDYAEFDSQDVAYDAFFKDLDIAVEQIENSGEGVIHADTDKSHYAGDKTKWIKFAKSLRLRLALRISNVDPSRAKTEAEKAVNHSLGVIETNADNFFIIADTNPLKTFNSSWNDIRMGAPMESYLKGYEDPRLGVFFEESEVLPGEYKGIRQGTDIVAKSDYQPFSKIGTAIEDADIQLMTAAEVAFLRAEGAVKGWSMGMDAQTAYETGVQLSFEQHGVSGASDYLADATKTPADYTDPVSSVNNDTAQSTITVAWNEAAAMEEKIERIATQKWIAIFPDGQEAWSEVRRTGYPKLFTVVNNNSGGKISTEEFIKRINFPASEKLTNAAEVEKAVSLLGGPDTGGTALWWDVN